ncbi:MAG TPA: hypothetical protein PLD23_18525 [Armatimonadota bacterium]|nr:hypothetical protein [Armatimonadota bacterium]
MRATPVIVLAVLSGLLAATVGAQAAEQRAWRFAEGLPAEARVAGDVTVADAPEGAGPCLRVGRGAEVLLPFAKEPCRGSARLSVYESGFALDGDAAKEYRFGPMFGVSNTADQVFVVGCIWAPFLDGNSVYGWVSTAQNGWSDRWYTGVKRQRGWHTFEFVVGQDATVQVLYDGNAVQAIDPVGTGFAAGFSGIYLRGPKDVDDPLVVAEASVTFEPGAPKRVLKPFPRTEWPLPATHPVRPDPAWTHGYPRDESFFPIGVWLQDPANAERYKSAGFNTYVGLWQGPTEKQLAALKAAGMWVICDQNEVGLAHIADPTIVAWMHGDEPDNAQPMRDPQTGQDTYGPPVPPQKIVDDYHAIREKDPSRPVLLNLGQGVANEDWIGRGSEGRPEDYDTYVLGADIVSFDVYPMADSQLAASNRYLWLVPKGVDRLRKLTNNQKIIWTVLECTGISGPDHKPTPEQVRAEAWMAIIHGVTGLVYFVHQFGPTFSEAALLEDPAMLAEVTAINHRIGELAPVLNSPTRADLATVDFEPTTAPVDILVKRHGGDTYVFAVEMQEEAAKATFAVAGLTGGATAEVIGEDRTIPVTDGAFADDFGPHAVHLYRIGGGR